MRNLLKIAGGLLAVAAVGVGIVGYRGYRVYNVAKDLRSEVRYLIENGTTIGEAPAAETFSANYLDAIFGENPELLDQLKSVVSQGLAEDPSLNLGEVAAMVVTYRKTPEGKVVDVVAHVAGGFPLGKRKPGFHRDGYFKNQIDENLWEAGNTVISFVGRDLIVFAEDEALRNQEDILEGIYVGNIMPLVDSLGNPLYFTAVFPDPKRVVPLQLKNHVQACIIKGHLGMYDGSLETIFLTPSPKSASYALSLLSDLKLASVAALRTRWSGAMQQTAWGEQQGTWWSYEMANTIEGARLEKEQNIVRAKTTFDRVMINASLKVIERFGRDLAQMRGSMEERLDPRLVDARMKSQKPLHYWADEHKWGPNWPIRSQTNITPVQATSPGGAQPEESKTPTPPVSQAL
jgi:hypothetical protein